MRLLLFTLSLTYFISSSAQVITGKTLDEKGDPLPFATLHIKGTTNGTTSNSSGIYELRVSNGQHTLVAQHIGYKKNEQLVTVSQPRQILDFTLTPEVLQLLEVVVSSDQEDPAYRIIREAIKKRKYYENEVNAYACDVYIKGVQRLDTFPEKILGIKLTLDTGIVYLSESMSEFKFMQPDKVNERMISSKVSGNNQAFSWNQASDMMINMYENSFQIQGLSERVFISPIANNAFLFYDYELKGTFQDGDKLVNKIQLLPKRTNDPVFDGHIYIIENDWRIYSIDALLTKARGIDFVDSLTLNQVFAEAQYGIWMPITQQFGFEFNVFKIKGSGYFNAVYSNYVVEPNAELFAKNEQNLPAIPNLFAKKDFSNEIMFVEEGSNEKDSTYWKNVRPIPLNSVEVKDYHVKDSIRVIKESEVYKDSVDTERNKLTVGKLLLTGYTIHRTFDGKRFDFPTVLTSFQYNTVEGAVTNLGFSYNRMEDDQLKFQISPSVRYGFSNEKFHARTRFWYRTRDKKFTSYFGGFGRYVSQINESNPVAAFPNTTNTLFFGESFVKLFEKGYAYGGFRQELVNGLLLTARVEYANRSQLFNTADFSFRDSTNFELNQPVNIELNDTSFPQHQALVADFNFRIRFGQKYQTRPDRKINYKPKTPEFYVRYKKGFGLLGSDVKFDQWELSVTDDMSFGLVGTSQYHISTGGFFRKDDLPFINYQHFNGNRLSYSRVDGLRQFQLLDYYFFSTNDNYLEAHYEHHFNGFIMNKFPLIRKLRWQTVASAHYLTTPAAGNYMEVGVGIEHIFKFMRIDYYRAIQDGKLDNPVAAQAIRFGFGF
jgi:hypothetical protein